MNSIIFCLFQYSTFLPGGQDGAISLNGGCEDDIEVKKGFEWRMWLWVNPLNRVSNIEAKMASKIDLLGNYLVIIFCYAPKILLSK